MKTDQIFIEPMASKSVAVVWSLLAISVQSSFSRPVQEFSKSRTIRSSPIFDDVQGYLTQFGYLPESDIETGNLRTEDQLHDALRTLQMFGNIPITGQMDAATKELLRKPRCGLPDVTPGQNQRRKRRYTLQGQKWQHTNLTWSLRTRHLERIDHGWVRADLHKAFQVWSRHSKLTFREVNSESADILVFFEKGFHGDGFPFDGPGQVLAHAFFPGSGRGGDAHFDEDEEWLLNGKETVNGTSLFMVAAHEFGHSLGLSHSSAQSALMFPWYQGHIKSDSELPEDDRFGIQILYGSKDDRIWGNIPVYRPLPNRPNTATTTTTTTSTTTTTAATTTTTTTTTTMTRAATTSTSPVVNAGTSKTRSPGVRIIPVVNDKPDYCNTSFDAVSIIRKDTFFFKGKYTWRLGTKNGLYPGYPALISRLWYDLPDNMTHVDAVYEKQDGNIVFFIGRRCYLFDGNILVSGYPKPLTALGLPEELDRVDAATVWGHNSKTYIFSGTMYWRYDDETERMELDYPRDMNIWRGVGDNINAAFQWHDGATYFLKGRDFWKFNDLRMRVDRADPRSVGQYWFNCTGADGVGDRIPNAGNKGGRVTVVRGKAGGRVGDEPIESGDGQTSNSSARSGGPPILSLLPFAVVFLRRRRPS